MDLRKEFVVAALAPGANFSQVCGRFGISRTNGYKWLRRYRAHGELGLQDKSRRPLTFKSTDGETVLRLIELRRQYRKWGAKKLGQRLLKLGHSQIPSTKTIARILDRVGEPRVRQAPRRCLRVVVRDREKLDVKAPNDVWTVDFKGWWRTRDGRRYEPLTVRDAFSRSILCLEMLPSTKAESVKPVFERLFQCHGLPQVIRVDNGSPFACTRAPAGLSRLSAWWTAVGIRVSFGRPGHPQDNGSHERMHADIAAELEADPASSRELQQEAAERWRQEFNDVRPHEALGMRTPSDLFKRSTLRYRGIRLAAYPASYSIRRVSSLGCVRYAGRAVYISLSVAGYDVGVRRVSQSETIRVSFYGLDLGTFDLASAPQHHASKLFSSDQLPTRKKRASGRNL